MDGWVFEVPTYTKLFSLYIS